MTTTASHRRLDMASLALLLVGLVFGVIAYWLISVRDVNALIIIPSVVAVTMGACHITKREAPRR